MPTETDTLVAAPVEAAPAPSGKDSTTAGRLELDKLFDNANKLASSRAVQPPANPEEPAPEGTIDTTPVSSTTPAPETTPAPVLEASPAPAPVVPNTPPPAAEEGTDDDDKAARAILDNPHATKRQKRPWEKYLSERDAHKKYREVSEAEKTRLATELEEARRKSTAAADYEEQKAARVAAEAEAAKYRAVVELENDPAFQQKYGEKETRLNSVINRALGAIGIKEKAWKTQNSAGQEVDAITLEYINQHGGIIKFAKTHPDNYRQILSLLDQADPVEADAMRRAVGGLVEVESDKQAEIAQIKKTPQTYAQQRQLREQQAQQQQAQRQEQIAQALNTHREAEFGKHEAFKILPIPDKASAEERSRIEAANTLAQKNRDALRQVHDGVFMGKFNPTELADGALRAVLYESEKQKNASLASENKALREENDKLKRAGLIKPAGTTLPSPASARQTSQPAVTQPKNTDEVAKTTLEIADELARKRAGQASGNLM